MSIPGGMIALPSSPCFLYEEESQYRHHRKPLPEDKGQAIIYGYEAVARHLL